MTNDEFMESYRTEASAVLKRIVDGNVKAVRAALDGVDIGMVQTAASRSLKEFVSRHLDAPHDAWEKALFEAIKSRQEEFRLNPKFTETDDADVQAALAALPKINVPTLAFSHVTPQTGDCS